MKTKIIFLLDDLASLDRKLEQFKKKIAKLKAYIQYLKESIDYCKDFDIIHCNDLNTLPNRFYRKEVF